WIRAGKRCAPEDPCLRGTPEPVCEGGQGGLGECLRRSQGEAAGVKPDASPVDRGTANVGTAHRRSFLLSLPSGDGRDRCDARGGGCAGWSRRSSPSRGKPVHMAKGGSGFMSVLGSAMSGEALVNTGAPVIWPDENTAYFRVRRMQTKLHQWAQEDPVRRFDDLFNLVYDPEFLVDAFERVARNKGART